MPIRWSTSSPTNRTKQPRLKTKNAAPGPHFFYPHSSAVLFFFTYIQFKRQFFELLQMNGRRGIDHHIACRIILRKGNHITNGIQSRHQRSPAIKAKGDAAVWRCPVLKGRHQEAKLRLGIGITETQHLKHLLLQLIVVDTNGASTQFHTVNYRSEERRVGKECKSRW